MIEQAFTKLSHWIQRTFGLTSYQQAVHCAIIVAWCCIIKGSDYYFPGLLSGDSSMTALLLYLCSSAVWVLLALTMDFVNKRFLSSPQAVPARPPNIMIAAIRGLMLGTFIGTSWTAYLAYTGGSAGHIEFLHPVSAFFTVCFNYVAYIPPLPPGKSKVKEWLESFKAAPKPAHSEA